MSLRISFCPRKFLMVKSLFKIFVFYFVYLLSTHTQYTHVRPGRTVGHMTHKQTHTYMHTQHSYTHTLECRQYTVCERRVTAVGDQLITIRQRQILTLTTHSLDTDTTPAHIISSLCACASVSVMHAVCVGA